MSTEEQPAKIRRNDAIALLGISPATFDRYVRSGVLPKVENPEPGPGQPPSREVWVYKEHVDAVRMKRSGQS